MIHKIASEIIVCEMAIILFRGQWVDSGFNVQCVKAIKYNNIASSIFICEFYDA